jgi:hypothetical protein
MFLSLNFLQVLFNIYIYIREILTASWSALFYTSFLNSDLNLEITIMEM